MQRSRGRVARQPRHRASARRIGPAQARLIAALAVALGVALLARMAHWPLAGVAAAGLAGMVMLVNLALARRPRAAAPASARSLCALTPLEFEHYVATWFRARGYRVEHCGGRGDGGVDVRIRRGGRAAIVQCKRYGPAHPVGPAVVRELVGARTLLGAQEAWLATTGRVTLGAQQLARAERIHLLDAGALAAPPPPHLAWWRTRRTAENAAAYAGMRLAEGAGESP